MARAEFGIYSSTEYELTNRVTDALVEAADFAKTSVMSEVASLPEGLPELAVIDGTDKLSTRLVGEIALGYGSYPTKLIPGIIIQETGKHSGDYRATVLTSDGLYNADGVRSIDRGLVIPRLLVYSNPEKEQLRWLNCGALAAQKVA